MQQKNKYKKLIRRAFTILLWAFVLPISAQQNPHITQYTNSPLLMNPAVAGSRNSLALDLSTRQQWVGVEGSPMTYMANAHTPINDTRMALGASLMSDIAGPVMANHFSLAYAYLLTINHSHFLSLGINAGINSNKVSLSSLRLNDNTDKNFAGDINHTITPSFGAGLMLYSPYYFLSFSMPRVLPSNAEYPGEGNLEYSYNQQYFLSGGTQIAFTNDHSVRLSALARFEDSMESVYDITALYNYAGIFTAGGSYRPNYAVALILGLQINENFGIHYSYDFPMGSKAMNWFNFQELTLSFDLRKYFKTNLDREFSKPRSKSPTRDDGSARSIRHF